MSEGAGRAGWRVGSIDFRASRRDWRRKAHHPLQAETSEEPLREPHVWDLMARLSHHGVHRSIRYIVRYTHLREQAAQVAEAEGPTERKCPRTTRLVTEADQKVRRRRRIARAAPADNLDNARRPGRRFRLLCRHPGECYPWNG